MSNPSRSANTQRPQSQVQRAQSRPRLTVEFLVRVAGTNKDELKK